MIIVGLCCCIGSAIALYFIYGFTAQNPSADAFIQSNPWLIAFIVPGAMIFSWVGYFVIVTLGITFLVGIFFFGVGLFDWEDTGSREQEVERLKADNRSAWIRKLGRYLAPVLALCLALLLTLGIPWSIWAYSAQKANEPINGAGTPTIWFTNVPPIGSQNDLAGQVAHVKSKDFRVAVYIKVGEGWWTKPTYDRPTVAISADGHWTCDITTGGDTDLTATQIAAFLLPKNCTPPIMNGLSSFPLELMGNAVSNCTIARS